MKENGVLIKLIMNNDLQKEPPKIVGNIDWLLKHGRQHKGKLLLAVCVIVALFLISKLEIKNFWKSKFTVKLITSMTFIGRPGPMIFVYGSDQNRKISPINVALYVEIANNKDTHVKLQKLETRALIQYDPDGSASQKNISKWRPLYNMGFLADQVYFNTTKYWNNFHRLDFSDNSFIKKAQDKLLEPGESIVGWILYQLDLDLRGKNIDLMKFEFDITDSSGDRDVIKITPPAREYGQSFIENSNLISKGKCDLSNEKYTIVPMLGIRNVND